MPVAPAVDETVARDLVDLEKRALQTDLWHLLQVLYPLPTYRWSESVHKTICENLFVRKNPDLPLALQSDVKQRLYIDPRNHFKTTLDICDIVQWILCFPDIRILIASGTRDHAISMLSSVKSHFQYNEVVRDFFPDYCPRARKAEDFGTLAAFICPARKRRELREPTCSIASPESAVASQHYDVEKFDDLVDETNSRTKEGLLQVKTWFKQTNPLLEPYGYRDLIGTIYSFDDLNSEQLGSYAGAEHFFGMVNPYLLASKRGCYVDNGETKEPLFPERNGSKEATMAWLAKERATMGMFLFSHNYLNMPLPGDAAFFPQATVEKAFIPKSELPLMRAHYTTVDLAISQNADADNTAIVTCGIGFLKGDSEPTLIIERIDKGHFKPEDTINRIFDVNDKYHPQEVRTEEVGFTALLKPLLDAECAKKSVFLPMRWMKRYNRQTKEARIAAMQPFFEQGRIRIVKDINNSDDLVQELIRFPKTRRDDIIDALADQLDFLRLHRGSYMQQDLPELTAKNGNPRLGLVA